MEVSVCCNSIHQVFHLKMDLGLHNTFTSVTWCESLRVCSWKQHDNTWSDVYSICHDKMEINSLRPGRLQLCINIPCIRCCSFPLFPKQTFGNGPTSEVSVCYCLCLMVVLFSFARVGHTCHFWDIWHLQISKHSQNTTIQTLIRTT